MNLLHPTALLLGLAALPVAALYILRLRREEVTVPSTLIWRRMEQRRETSALWRRLRKLLSLLLNLAILAGATLAVARPFLSDRLAPQRVVVVLDASASMQAREGGANRFERARELAAQMVSDLSIEDRMAVVAASARPRVLSPLTSDKRALREAIAAARPRDSGTDLAEALRLAYALCRAGDAEGAENEVYVLSDGAAPASGPRALDRLGGVPPRTRVFFCPIGAKGASNLGITAFSLRRVFNADSEFELLATVENGGTTDASCTLEIALNGVAHAARDGMRLAPAQSEEVLLRGLVLREEGVLEARLLPGDDLPADDRAFAVVPAHEKAKVLLVAPEANMFLNSALALDEGISADALAPAAWPPKGPYEVYVFCNWAPAELPEGSSIVIHAPGGVTGVAVEGEIDAPVLSDWKRDHPVMAYVLLEGVHFLKAQKFECPPWAETLAEAYQTPLVVAGARGSRRIVYIGFDPLDSDIVLRSAFPLLLANAVRWLKEIRSKTHEPTLRAGEVAYVRFPDAAAEALLVRPSGEEVRVAVEGGEAAYADTEAIGVYRAEAAKAPPRRFAVNLLDPEESRIEPRDRLSVGEETIRERRARRNRELSDLAVLAAVAALLLEWWLYHRRQWF